MFLHFVQSLNSVQNQPSESDANAKKGGRNPLDYISKDLLLFDGADRLEKTKKKKTEKRFGIKNCWPADDIKQATQGIDLDSSRRRRTCNDE